MLSTASWIPALISPLLRARSMVKQEGEFKPPKETESSCVGGAGGKTFAPSIFSLEDLSVEVIKQRLKGS